MFSRFRLEVVRRCPSDCIAARYNVHVGWKYLQYEAKKLPEKSDRVSLSRRGSTEGRNRHPAQERNYKVAIEGGITIIVA